MSFMIPTWTPPELQGRFRHGFKWEKRFIRMVILETSTWSKDPDERVGAMAVSQDRRTFVFGYNGFPRGIVDDYRLGDKDEKNRLMVHAELNVLLNAKADVAGWVLYCTKSPCIECAKAIIQKDIHRVVAVSPRSDSRWIHDQVYAAKILTEASVAVNWIELETPQ